MDRKDKETLWIGAAVSVGTAVLVTFLASPQGAIPKWSLVSLFVFGAGCFTIVVWALGWIRKSLAKPHVLRAALTVAAIWGVLGFLMWRLLPVDPYCYFLPAIFPYPGSEGNFPVYVKNPTGQSLEDVSFRIIERLEPNESPERAMDRTRKARMRKVGHVRANYQIFLIEPQFLIPVSRNKSNSYWLQIYTKDETFFETLTLNWSNDNWQIDCELSNQSRKKLDCH